MTCTVQVCFCSRPCGISISALGRGTIQIVVKTDTQLLFSLHFYRAMGVHAHLIRDEYSLHRINTAEHCSHDTKSYKCIYYYC